jgi:hypothetical protein
VLAVLVPLAGVGRRVAHAHLLQVLVLSHAASYALQPCAPSPGSAGPAGWLGIRTEGPGAAWRVLPEFYLAAG